MRGDKTRLENLPTQIKAGSAVVFKFNTENILKRTVGLSSGFRRFFLFFQGNLSYFRKTSCRSSAENARLGPKAARFPKANANLDAVDGCANFF